MTSQYLLTAVPSIIWTFSNLILLRNFDRNYAINEHIYFTNLLYLTTEDTAARKAKQSLKLTANILCSLDYYQGCKGSFHFIFLCYSLHFTLHLLRFTLCLVDITQIKSHGRGKSAQETSWTELNRGKLLFFLPSSKISAESAYQMGLLYFYWLEKIQAAVS